MIVSPGVYDRVRDFISEVRRKVCPRTSYATSGAAASVLYSYVHEDATIAGVPSLFKPLADVLIESREFDEVVVVSALHELHQRVNGNVVVMFGVLHPTAISDVESLFSDGRTKLVVLIALTTTKAPAINTALSNSDHLASSSNAMRLSTMFDLKNFSFSEGELLLSVDDPCCRLCITACHSYKLKRSSSSSVGLTGLGFNRQPSVQSLGQFSFLWRGEGESSLECKERVLQRLADREVKASNNSNTLTRPRSNHHNNNSNYQANNNNNKNKYSVKEWEDLIEAALSAGQNDYHIYDLVRRHVLGSSLEEDTCLRTGHRLAAAASPSTQAAAAAAESSKGSSSSDGRANFMVQMALDCIPTTTRHRLEQGGRYMLDYGCAEGSITSSLGQALHMKPEYVLGADVRAIPSAGFSFIQLPAEEDDSSRPPAPRSILSSLRDQSVEFITASMVLHHVTHIEAVLQELRRVIAHDGLLLLREHHCSGPEMAAFLDITHGLYSLSWSDPVEWPDFVSEYKAFYRSQQEWDALLLRAGFKLALSMEGSSEAAAESYKRVQVQKKRPNGSYPNLIKAYYAVYQPTMSVETSSSSATNARPSKRSLDDDDYDACAESNDSGVLKRRSCVTTIATTTATAATTTTTATAGSKDRGPQADEQQHQQLFESKKYPGRFYRVNQRTGATEWIP